jgi:hypothetical protein
MILGCLCRQIGPSMSGCTWNGQYESIKNASIEFYQSQSIGFMDDSIMSDNCNFSALLAGLDSGWFGVFGMMEESKHVGLHLKWTVSFRLPKNWPIRTYRYINLTTHINFWHEIITDMHIIFQMRRWWEKIFIINWWAWRVHACPATLEMDTMDP